MSEQHWPLYCNVRVLLNSIKQSDVCFSIEKWLENKLHKFLTSSTFFVKKDINEGTF
jgi:hypothetical protein